MQSLPPEFPFGVENLTFSRRKSMALFAAIKKTTIAPYVWCVAQALQILTVSPSPPRSPFEPRSPSLQITDNFWMRFPKQSVFVRIVRGVSTVRDVRTVRTVRPVQTTTT